MEASCEAYHDDSCDGDVGVAQEVGFVWCGPAGGHRARANGDTIHIMLYYYIKIIFYIYIINLRKSI